MEFFIVSSSLLLVLLQTSSTASNVSEIEYNERQFPLFERRQLNFLKPHERNGSPHLDGK